MNNLISIRPDGNEIYQDEPRDEVTADNVVSINRNKVLGTYINAQERKGIPDEAYFVAGVIFSLALPQFIYCLYGGLLSVVAFAGSGLAGLILGFAMYRRSPYWPSSFLGIGALSQAPPSEGVEPRKAA